MRTIAKDVNCIVQTNDANLKFDKATICDKGDFICIRSEKFTNWILKSNVRHIVINKGGNI